jgi:hypothetical protein
MDLSRGDRLRDGRITSGPPVEPNCQRCGEPLAAWALYLGLCGPCLTESERAARGIPQPRYRGE